MNHFLTLHKIKEMCGEVSYKKGRKYFLDNKVRMENYEESSESYYGTVQDEFYVHIEERNGEIYADCTCPKLASIQTHCQHVAAVLIHLYEERENGGLFNSNGPIKETAASGPEHLADRILQLFHTRPGLTITNKYYAEERSTFQLSFAISPFHFENESALIGVRLEAGSPIQDPREFLTHVQQGKSYEISSEVFYNPELHCFSPENNELITVLMEIAQLNRRIDFSEASWLLVPPSHFEILIQIMAKNPLVRLFYSGYTYSGVELSDGAMPLEFVLAQGPKNAFQLKFKGLEQAKFLPDYKAVLLDGNFYKLEQEDFSLLFEMQRLMKSTGQYYISILPGQLEHYVEKTLPWLRRFGKVIIPDGLSHGMQQTPLKARLFLDRVKNRLLASLEFHYGHVIVNPVEDFPSLGLFANEHSQEHRILQLLEKSGFTRTESGYYLHNEEAEYLFLKNTVPILKEEVEVLATTAVQNRIFTLKTPPKVRVEVDERTDWLVFSFSMEGIPESEIKAVLKALAEKRSFYRFRDERLLSLETAEFQEILRFIDTTGLQYGDESGIKLPFHPNLHHLAAFENVELDTGLSLENILSSLKSPENLELSLPGNFSSILHEYQKTGVKWLRAMSHYKFGGILADDMGLGKTLQSIVYISSCLSEIREKSQPVMVAAPSSLLYNWANEFKKFAPDVHFLVVDGDSSERRTLIRKAKKTDVIITSYPLLRHDYSLYKKISFHTLFFDEAQAFKNHTTQTHKAVRSLKAQHKFALTGTPVENSLGDLWSIFKVVFPTLLPDRRTFKKLPRKRSASLVSPFILRRVKADVLKELPEKRESILLSNLLPEQKKLYAAYLARFKHETLKHLNTGTFQQNQLKILAAITRLRQLCCHPALFVEGYNGQSAKLQQFMNVVREGLGTGKRILVFSQFTKMLELISRELGRQGISFFYLDGKTPSSERTELCIRFNDGEKEIFLISLKAGGTGLNLTGADTVILYDLWWNPAVEQQAFDRAHRMGQKKKVEVFKLVSRGTIEEKINALQEKKKQLLDGILEPDEKRFDLTEEDIREILL